MTETVTIKGTSEGLVISLGPGPLRSVLEEMEVRLSAKASFFVGGRVALRVGDRPLSAEQLEMIGKKLEELGVTLWAVDGEHPTTQAAAQELGLETNLHPTVQPSSSGVEHIPREEMAGIVELRTLRSGQALRHAGHVTLIGDVNPGAEIVAGGDIIVWGKLRGIAHAGAMGNDQAIICALELAPSQIRIGSHIARPPERGRPPRVPEIATVQEGRIVVESWNKGGWSLDLGALRLEFGS
jgi:septum site-determining protein MinC